MIEEQPSTTGTNLDWDDDLESDPKNFEEIPSSEEEKKFINEYIGGEATVFRDKRLPLCKHSDKDHALIDREIRCIIKRSAKVPDKYFRDDDYVVRLIAISNFKLTIWGFRDKKIFSIDNPPDFDPIYNAARDPIWKVRQEAAGVLFRHAFEYTPDDPRLLPTIETLMMDPEIEVRRTLVELIQSVDNVKKDLRPDTKMRLRPIFEKFWQDPDPWKRALVGKVIGSSSYELFPNFEEILFKMMEDKDKRVRKAWGYEIRNLRQRYTIEEIFKKISAYPIDENPEAHACMINMLKAEEEYLRGNSEVQSYVFNCRLKTTDDELSSMAGYVMLKRFGATDVNAARVFFNACYSDNPNTRKDARGDLCFLWFDAFVRMMLREEYRDEAISLLRILNEDENSNVRHLAQLIYQATIKDLEYYNTNKDSATHGMEAYDFERKITGELWEKLTKEDSYTKTS